MTSKIEVPGKARKIQEIFLETFGDLGSIKRCHVKTQGNWFFSFSKMVGIDSDIKWEKPE